MPVNQAPMGRWDSRFDCEKNDGEGHMKHEDIWRALDTLAAENGLSASGLAKRSGLDATTFNPSKRRMPDGRARWPSTESLAKVLDATGASLEAFMPWSPAPER